MYDDIINGSFDIWQLGEYFIVSGDLQKLSDRWNFSWNGSLGTLVAQRVRNIFCSSDIYFDSVMRLTQVGGASGNTFYDFSTQIEDVNTFQGETIIVSFWAYSAVPCDPILVKTEQYFGGPSPIPSVFNTSLPLSIGINSWGRYSVPFDIAPTWGKSLGADGDSSLDVIFTLPLNQIFDIYIAGVQIDKGCVAQPQRRIPISKTFHDCQRYIQTSYTNGVAPGTLTSEGVLTGRQLNGMNLHTIEFKTPMRVRPAVSFFSPATGASGSWNGDGSPVPVAINTNGTKNITACFPGNSGSFYSGHFLAQDPYY